MERYCRANVLLEPLQHALSPSKCSSTFQTEKYGPYESKLISKASNLTWIRITRDLGSRVYDRNKFLENNRWHTGTGVV